MTSPPPSGEPQARRIGLAALLVVAVAVAASWYPSLRAPLGDNHEGRVAARFALHVRNFEEHGARNSGWLSSMAPYAGRYAHHPPGPNVAQAAIAAALPGNHDSEARLFPYASGIAAIAAAAWLLRVLRTRWPAVVSGCVLMIATPLFWDYGRLLWDVPWLFAIPAAVISSARHPTRKSVVVASLLVLVGVTMSWITAVFAGSFLTLMLIRREVGKGFTAQIGAWCIGVALVAVWLVAAAPSPTDLSEQLEFRTAGGDFDVADFLRRQWRWISWLLPVWLLLVLPLGLKRAWGDRWRRDSFVLTLLLSILFVVALPNGAYIHDYWMYPALVPLTLAAAFASEWLLERLPSVGGTVWTAGAALLGALAALALATGPHGDAFRTAEAAGRLAASVKPSSNQEIAWTADPVGTARWLSVYWDMPARSIDDPALSNTRGSDLVIVQLPLTEEFGDVPLLATEGQYGIVLVGDLRKARRPGRQWLSGDGHPQCHPDMSRPTSGQV